MPPILLCFNILLLSYLLSRSLGYGLSVCDLFYANVSSCLALENSLPTSSQVIPIVSAAHEHRRFPLLLTQAVPFLTHNRSPDVSTPFTSQFPLTDHFIP